MQILRASNKNQYKNIKKLYYQAFPKEERKPFSMLLYRHLKGNMELFSIESDAGLFLGLAIFAYNDDIVLLDYFAISKDYRCKNFGSEAIKLLLNQFKDKRFILEIESTKIDSKDHQIRKRRKDFYIKNGLHTMDFDVILFGIEMEILSNCNYLSFEEYLDVYIKTCGKKFRKRISLV